MRISSRVFGAFSCLLNFWKLRGSHRCQRSFSAIRGRFSLKKSASLAGVLLLAVVSMSMWGALSHGGVAGALPTAPTVTQCDAASISAPSAFPTGADYQVTCTITIVNNVSASGATSSTVTASACLAAAGVTYPNCPDNLNLVPALLNPSTIVTTSSQLVTSVNQCNSIVNGGGSNVICNVSVTNNVPSATPTTNVTVDQCVGSATGGGSGVPNCTPIGNTTSATVTQCNGSATGGGTYTGTTAVNCTVTGATAALPVTINQCNGSATGGGSSVTCSATVVNNFAPTTTTTVIPVGPPATGFGGAAGPGGTPHLPLILGSLSLSALSGGMALRERRRNRRLRTGGHGSHDLES